MKKKVVVPHVKRRGWLKNNNPPGDFSKAPRCGALTRQKTFCQAPAMKNGRCRLHGGKSTGPKTLQGKKKAAHANLRHGLYSNKHLSEKEKIKQITKALIKFLKEH